MISKSYSEVAGGNFGLINEYFDVSNGILTLLMLDLAI